MWIETMFYLIFLGQVMLISYYYPSKVLTRMNYIFEHYPPASYAKLYSDGYEKALEKKLYYKILNNIFLVLGLAIFTILVIASVQRDTVLAELDAIPLVYGIVQAIPFIFLEVSALKELKLMRQQNLATKRQAQLSPRHIFNFVSPFRVYSALVLFVLCIFIMFSFNDFKWSEEIVIVLGTMLLCNGLFLGLGYTLVKGKKLDPHQSPQDRKTMSISAFHSYTSMSMLVSVLLIITNCVNHYSLDNWEPIINSLYFQAVVALGIGTMLKSMSVDDINFEVYKGSAKTTS